MNLMWFCEMEWTILGSNRSRMGWMSDCGSERVQQRGLYDLVDESGNCNRTLEILQIVCQ